MNTSRSPLEVLSWVAGILGTVLAYFLFFSTPSPGSVVKINDKAEQQPSEKEQSVKPSVTVSPSFDCPRASNKAERLICATPELAVLDLSLANAYRDLWAERTSADLRQQLKVAQNYWLRNVRDHCTEVECLKTAYETRITDLRNARR